MKKLLFSTLLAGTFLMAQSCTDKPKESTEVAEEANEDKVEAGATTVAGEDKDEKTDATDFAVKAAEGSLFEIEAARIAMQKGNTATKDMAKMIMNDHQTASDELTALAKTKNITLPMSLSDEKQKDLKDLNEKTGKDFDEKYIDLMERDHERDTKMFRKASEDLEDPELKAWASKTLPNLEKHLSMVEAADDRDKNRNRMGDDAKAGNRDPLEGDDQRAGGSH